jgi:hypothetical protein
MKYWTGAVAVAVAILPYAWIHVYFKRLTAGLLLERHVNQTFLFVKFCFVEIAVPDSFSNAIIPKTEDIYI